MRVYRNLTSARSTATTIFPFRRRGRAHLHPHTAARRLRVIDGTTSRRSVGRQFYCRQRFTVQSAWTMLRRIGSGSFIRSDAACTLTAPGRGVGLLVVIWSAVILSPQSVPVGRPVPCRDQWSVDER